MPVPETQFRQSMSRLASGVTVVAAFDGKVATGLTVTAFSSLSLHPPLILVCIDQRSSALPILRRAGAFSVNFLRDNQQSVAEHFANPTSTKFAGVSHSYGLLATPLLANTLATLECRLEREVNAGDHAICIGSVESACVEQTGRPLLYYSGQYGVWSSC